MIAPGNHCIERFAALCNTLPYVPLPARTWHPRSTLTSLDYRFPGLSVAGAPLSLPCRFFSVLSLHSKNRHIFAVLRIWVKVLRAFVCAAGEFIKGRI